MDFEACLIDIPQFESSIMGVREIFRTPNAKKKEEIDGGVMYMLSKRLQVVFALIVLLILSFPTKSNASVSVSRIAGRNRIETAVEISKSGWETSSTVILARADDFPDALAGTPLAYHHDAPILLTSTKELSAETKQEIARLQADKIIILGGTGAVSSDVEIELQGDGLNVRRISGKNRYETAALIAQELPVSDTAVVVYGGNFPDALAVGPYSAAKGYPILLSMIYSIPSATSDALEQFENTIVVGGTNAISSTVFKFLPNPVRISGTTRYHTAAEVIRQLDMSSEIAFVATGQGFADALTGSALAAKMNAPIILVTPTSIPLVTSEVIRDKNLTEFIILGGTSAVADGLDFEYHEVTEVIISMDSLLLIEGGSTAKLTANVVPENATNSKIVWSSNNEKVAFVNNGLVTTNFPGTATITVTAEENGLSANCQVTVDHMPEWDDGNGNSLNNGYNYISQYNGWLYYYDLPRTEIRKVRLDGSDRRILLKKNMHTSLVVCNGWIYCIGEDNEIYRMKTDGTGLEQLELNGDNFDPRYGGRGALRTYRDKIFYSQYHRWIYQTDLLGLESTRIVTRPTLKNWIFRNNSFFGLDITYDQIYKYSFVTQETTLIGSAKAGSLNIEDGWLYYKNRLGSNRLYRINLAVAPGTSAALSSSGSNLSIQPAELVIDHAISSYIVHQGWIYYTKYADGDGGGLYKVSVSGDQFEVFHPTMTGELNICGDYLYLISYPNIHRFDFNGNYLGTIN